jgi:hypothetical protein
MPIHDWTKVKPGIFHHFHARWVPEISDVLNDGRLPSGYYALAEQVTGPIGPDVLTLQANNSANGTPTTGRVVTMEKPPKVRVIQKSEADIYLKKANRIAIRHSSDDTHHCNHRNPLARQQKQQACDRRVSRQSLVGDRSGNSPLAD